MSGFKLSNNGQGIDFNLFKDKLNLSDVKASPKFEQIFKFFDKDGNGVLEASNGEINNLLQGMSKYASSNGNSIFGAEEVQQYLEETVNNEGETLVSKNISVNDVFNFLKVLKVNEEVFTEEPESLTEEELQQVALETLDEDSNRARQVFNKQNREQGCISDSVNWVKELFNTENAATNIDRVLMIDEFSSHLIQRAASEEGITFREYYEAKIEFITQLIAQFDKSLDESELERCRESLAKLEPQRLDWIIQAIGTLTDACSPEEIPEMVKDMVVRQFEAQNSSLSILNISISEIPQMQAPASKPQTLEDMIASGEFDKKMTFEEAFQMERGVEYNPEAINDYALKNTQLQVLTGMNNNIAAIDIFLDKLREDKGEICCSAQLAEEINQFLQKFDMQVSNNRMDVLTTLIGLREKAEANYIKALGGRTLEDYSADASAAYQRAYGRNNIKTIVNNYIQSQQEGVQAVKEGVQVAGMVVMIAGQCIPVGGQLAAGMIYGGMAAATLGGSAISAAENFTKEGGPTEQDKKEMVAELSTAIALTATGAGIGKISESAFRMLVMKNCPKLLAWAAEIGLDATMSLVADAAITGDIDLSGEGFSQVLNVLVGIVRAKGHFKTYIDAHAGDIRKPIDDEVEVIDVVEFDDIPMLDEKAIGLIAGKPKNIQDKLTEILLDTKHTDAEIEAAVRFATEDNLDELAIILKKPDSETVIKVLEANPAYQKELMDIALNTARPATDLHNIAEFMKQYPAYANDIIDLTKTNPNIKVGYDLNGNRSTNIDNVVKCLEENPEYHDEIVEYMSVQRRDYNDTSDPTAELNNFVTALKTHPDKQSVITQLAKNPNLSGIDIYGYIHASKNRFKNDPQYLDDVMFFASKKFTERDINRNIMLIRRYPELRDVLVSETPSYKFIDNNPASTPSEVITQRFAMRDKLEEVAPSELETLRQTLGEDFYNKVRWEDIIPADATADDIKSILKTLNDECKFFARTSINELKYGKNIQWAHEMNVISELASSRISAGDDFDEVMEIISDGYSGFDKSTTLASNGELNDRRQYSGVYRGYDNPDLYAQTPFNNQNSYVEYFEKFKEADCVNGAGKNRKSPYPDMELTKIFVLDENHGLMFHPYNKTVNAGMQHVKEKYDELAPLFEKVKNGGSLTKQELEMANKNIAEMYFLLANIMPYARGSNGISDIFMRSVYKSLGIEQPALKHGISLDLEAFCVDMDTFAQKWDIFFEE